MSATSYIGYLAAFFTTIAFLPQALRVIRTRQTKDLSLAMYIFFTLGVLFWLVYGVLLVSLPMIVANSITLVLAFTILAMKLWHG